MYDETPLLEALAPPLALEAYDAEVSPNFTPLTCSATPATPTATAYLVRDYQALLTLLARKFRNRDLAEDLCQEAVLASLCKLAKDQIADRSKFVGYVYGVAHNLMRNHRRRMDNRSDLRLDIATLNDHAQDDQLADHDQQYRSRCIKRIIEELPMARDREIAHRFYLQEESKDSLCSDFGLSSTRFDKIAFRLRQRMKQLMEARGWSSSVLL